MKGPIISYEQHVSGKDETLQCFDFLSQTLDEMLCREGVDNMLLCELLKTVATSKQFAPTPLGTLLGQAPTTKHNTSKE